jgi:4-carboxymuconolactone decarboxylase
MKIFRGADVPTQLADPHSFMGRAHTQRLAGADDGVPVVVYHVEFEDGGRTNWHSHSGPQWLLITEGRVRVQKWGEPPTEAAAGDAVVIPPGEKHWHGAAPGARAVHLAVNISATTEWLEPVTEAQYLA